jgi:uncharacterized repeat protein (TIGR01451 family)
MNIKTKLASLFISAAIAMSAAAFAADQGPLQIAMNAYAISADAQGQEVATPTTEVDRKSTVEFRAAYKNNSADTLSNVMVVGPIPKTTEYQADTAQAPVDATFEVSIDGGKTFEGEPVKRVVNNVETVIPPSKYTHVRWMPTDGIPGNAEQVYSYRVKVK